MQARLAHRGVAGRAVYPRVRYVTFVIAGVISGRSQIGRRALHQAGPDGEVANARPAAERLALEGCLSVPSARIEAC